MSNPYTRFGFADDDEEDTVAPEKSYGNKKTGKTKRRNPYTQFGFGDEESEGSEVRAAAEKAAKDEEQKKKKEAAKSPLDHLGDAIGGVGNFIKDAAIDVKDTTVGAVGGIKNVIEGSVASSNALKMQEKRNAVDKTYSDQQNALFEGYDNAASIDDLPADRQKKWEELRKKRDAALKEFDKKNNFEAVQSDARKEVDESQKVDATKTAFQAGETVLNVGTLGLGTGVKQLAKQGVKTAVKKGLTDLAVKGGSNAMVDLAMAGGRQALMEGGEQVVKSGARRLAGNVAKDATVGAAYGVTNTGRNMDEDTDIGDFVQNAALGATIGGAIPIIGAGGKKVISKFSDTRIGQKLADGKVQKAADKAEEKFTREDGTIDVNAMMNEAAQSAADKHSKNIFKRVGAYIGDQANPLGFARAIDQNAAKRQGIKYADLPATESLEHNLQMRNRVDGIVGVMAKEKTITGKSFQDLAKKYAPDSDEAKEFANYTVAKYDLDRRTQNAAGKLEGGKSDRPEILSEADAGSLQKFVDDYETRNPSALEDLNTKNDFYTNAARELKEGGLISEKEFTDITSSSDVAVPFNRIFSDKEALTESAGITRRAGSIAKQSAIKGIKGGTEPVDASLDVVLQRVKKAVEQRIDNNIANKFRGAVEAGDIDGRIFQEAGAKEAKAAARTERIQTNKEARILGKKLAISNRQVKKLDREISKLNVEGMEASIKGAGAPEMPKQPIKTVTVKDVATVVKSNAPKVVDDLKQPLEVRQMLAKEYGEGAEGMAQMAADIHNGGWNQLLELGPKMNKNTAKSIASQVLKAPTVKEGGITVTEGTIGRAPTTQSIMKSLINMQPADVVRIQKKIATREPKLAAKLDKVIEQQQLIASKKAFAKELTDVEVGLTREGTTGKAFINGVDNGQTFRVELPPNVINSLDKLSKTEVNTALKILGSTNQIFRMAWVGALSPGFAVKSATWDVIMTAINSKDGARTLGPKAVVASFKALRESDEFLKQIRKRGASTVGSSQLGINERVSAESLNATKNLFSRVKFGAKNPQSVIDSLDVFGGKLASLGRSRAAKAAYDTAKRQKLGEEAALNAAAYAYNNVLPDFATMSPLIRQINTIIPFTNASIAGTRSLAQAFKRKPVATAAKVATMGVAPAIAIASYSMGSDTGKAFYDDMIAAGNEQTLDNNTIIVLPGAHKDDKTGEWSGVIKIPMTPEFRAINSQAWRQVYGGAKGADGVRMAADTFDFMTGGIRTLTNPLVQIKSILDGNDPRTGEELISDKMRDLPKEEQAYDTTSNAGRFVGKVLGTSPIQGDKILGQFGVAGSAAKKESPAEALTDSFTNTYTGAYGERAADSFYRAYNPISAQRSKVSKEVTQLVKDGRLNEARRKADEFNETVPGKFKEVVSKYKDSDSYSEDWDEMMDGLLISTSGSAFRARVKQ